MKADKRNLKAKLQRSVNSILMQHLADRCEADTHLPPLLPGSQLKRKQGRQDMLGVDAHTDWIAVNTFLQDRPVALKES